MNTCRSVLADSVTEGKKKEALRVSLIVLEQ